MKTAIHFSGGKDSLALVWFLRDWLAEATVYCVRQVEAFPETQQSIDWCKTVAPHFVEIFSERAGGTLPSDLVPTQATAFGRMVAGSDEVILVDRYVCCYNTLMAPLAARMLTDGVEVVYRGQKAVDKLKGPLASGTVVDGIRYEFPLDHWTDEEVFAYLRESSIPIPKSYTALAGGLDCVGCTAWWEEGRMAYLQREHPRIAEQTLRDLRRVQALIQPGIERLGQEVKHG